MKYKMEIANQTKLKEEFFHLGALKTKNGKSQIIKIII